MKNEIACCFCCNRLSDDCAEPGCARGRRRIRFLL
jgi:hypothetical protein